MLFCHSLLTLQVQCYWIGPAIFMCTAACTNWMMSDIDTSPFIYYYLSSTFDILALQCIERHRQTVAVRRSVASRSNVRPADCRPCLPEPEVGGLSQVWSSPAYVRLTELRPKMNLAILNVTKHPRWMDIECKAFEWPCAGQKFVYLPWNAAPMESAARGICPLHPCLKSASLVKPQIHCCYSNLA